MLICTRPSAWDREAQNGTSKQKELLDKLDWKEATKVEAEAQQLRTLVLEYADVFALTTSKLGSAELVYHVIDTADNPPCRQPVRGIPFSLREKVDQIVSDMLAQRVIRPSRSPWVSPIVLVAKKDGSSRFCVDYRRLNSITKVDMFPLPRVDESLDLLSKSRYFSTLDLSSGYWQVKMAPECIEKTQHDRHAKDPGFREGHRVYMHMPAYKFARPFKQPYQIIRLCANGAEVRLISKPQAGTIRVALN